MWVQSVVFFTVPSHILSVDPHSNLVRWAGRPCMTTPLLKTRRVVPSQAKHCQVTYHQKYVGGGRKQIPKKVAYFSPEPFIGVCNLFPQQCDCFLFNKALTHSEECIPLHVCWLQAFYAEPVVVMTTETNKIQTMNSFNIGH